MGASLSLMGPNCCSYFFTLSSNAFIKRLACSGVTTTRDFTFALGIPGIMRTKSITNSCGECEIIAIRVDFENRFCFVGALVIGDETLLGAVPMEDMDLVVHPATQKLMPNPLHPSKPSYTIR